MRRIFEATDARDQKLEAIAGKLADFRQIMINHGTQLRALYRGRCVDVAALVPDAAEGEPPVAGSSDAAE